MKANRKVDAKVRQRLIAILESCIQHSKFETHDKQIVGWNSIRNAYRRRRWSNVNWWIINLAILQIPDKPVKLLEAELAPILREYLHPKTNQIGNNLPRLTKTSIILAKPTLFDFAKLMISGAVKIGSVKIADLIFQWSLGEPLRFQQNALLEGIDIDQPLKLKEGVYLRNLPRSESELPKTLPIIPLPYSKINADDFLGSTLLSVDCEASPALYRPTDEEITHKKFRDWSSFKLTGDNIPEMSFKEFCESMSLAGNGCIDWTLGWDDYGDLEGIASNLPSTKSNLRSISYTRTKFTQNHLDDALSFQNARYRGRKIKGSLEFAIERWMKSKRQIADFDKLIDLRIALESLYEIGGQSEKAFRISIYGAWHLGETFEQRREYQKTLYQAYSDASQVLHAGKLRHSKNDPKLIEKAQDLCRRGILKRLHEKKPPEWEALILGGKA